MHEPITTTLARIEKHAPARRDWTKLLEGLGKTASDDEPLPYATILRIGGLDIALWCLRAEPQHALPWRLMAVRFARLAEHLLTIQPVLDALDVAERHANARATDAELAVARHLARNTAWSAAWAAISVTCTQAWEAAWDAARDSRAAIVWAVVATADQAETDRARGQALDTTMAAQTKIFFEIVEASVEEVCAKA